VELLWIETRLDENKSLTLSLPRPAILTQAVGVSRMPSGLGGVLVGGLWISLAVVAAYGVVVGGWRVIGRRNEEGIGLLLTGSTALVLFALLGVVMR
jgi:hypothetical protein